MAKLIPTESAVASSGEDPMPATTGSGQVPSPGPRPFERRVCIGALPLDPVTLEEAAAWTIQYIELRGGLPAARISCPNAAIVAMAEVDPAFAQTIAATDLVVADGLPLLWAASLLGAPLPGQVRGVDLMERICAAGAGRGMSFYILGGLQGAAAIAARRLVERHPGLRPAGVDCPPLGFESDPALARQAREKIAAAAPDFLIVGLGSPKQERWISANYRDLPVGAIQGVGAAVDTCAGFRKRPPAWMRNLGLEWLGRLLAEPQRLWRRYLFGNVRFLSIVFRQWRRSRRKGARSVC